VLAVPLSKDPCIIRLTLFFNLITKDV